MVQVFPALVIADGLLFLGAICLGLFVRGEQFYPQHFILGLFTIIVTVLIHVVVFTYFAAGGKMISQAVFIGHLDQEPLHRVRRHKAKVTRCIGMSFLSLVSIVVFGALVEKDPSWQWWHIAAVLIAITTNAVSFYVQYNHIVQNAQTTAKVFEQYNAAKGKPAS